PAGRTHRRGHAAGGTRVRRRAGGVRPAVVGGGRALACRRAGRAARPPGAHRARCGGAAAPWSDRARGTDAHGGRARARPGRRPVVLTAAPPTDRERATLHNWQDPPYNRWAFSHVRELIPTQRIARAAAPATPLPTDLQPLGDVRVGTESSVDVVLDATSTDGVVVVHRGRVVFERYAGETGPRTPHLLMSVSKSIVGCVVANLVERGHLARDRLITDHVPEL